MSHALPASIFWAQAVQMPFLFKNRLSLNEVEKFGRRAVRVILSLVCSAGATLFNNLLILIAILLFPEGSGHVFQEIEFATGVELGEGQSFSWADGEATPAVRAESLLSNPACGVFK